MVQEWRGVESGTGSHVPGVGASILRARPAHSRKRVAGRSSGPFLAGPMPRRFPENAGDSSTVDLSYRMPHAAEVLDRGTMTYRLDVDPQDLVSPQLFHISVTWPEGYRPSGALPVGWKATKTGATFDGAITTHVAWEVPLVHG